MVNENDTRKNCSGYPDPTAHQAIQNADREDERFHKFLELIFSICELSGFHIEERIVVRDKRSGRVWR